MRFIFLQLLFDIGRFEFEFEVLSTGSKRLFCFFFFICLIHSEFVCILIS